MILLQFVSCFSLICHRLAHAAQAAGEGRSTVCCVMLCHQAWDCPAVLPLHQSWPCWPQQQQCQPRYLLLQQQALVLAALFTA